MPHKDPEERRACGRAWMKRNPEKARDAMRRWRLRHLQEKKAAARDYYERHREQIIAKVTAYLRERPEVRLQLRQQRRARELSAEGSFTATEWLSLVDAFHHRCAYCGAEGPLHADHRVPLARGGTNFISNILPACASCDQRKYLSTEEEFRARLQRERRIEERPQTGYRRPADPNAALREHRPSEDLPLNFISSAG